MPKAWRRRRAAAIKLDQSTFVSLDHGQDAEGIESDRLDDVAPGRAELPNLPDTRQSALSAAPGEDGDQIYGLRDKRSRDGHDGLLHQLLETAERADRGRGMDRADPTGMSRAPRFQPIQRLRTTHLAYRDAIGPEPERGAHQIGQRRDAILGAHRDQVPRCTLHVAGICD